MSAYEYSETGPENPPTLNSILFSVRANTAVMLNSVHAKSGNGPGKASLKIGCFWVLLESIVKLSVKPINSALLYNKYS